MSFPITPVFTNVAIPSTPPAITKNGATTPYAPTVAQYPSLSFLHRRGVTAVLAHQDIPNASPASHAIA